MTAGERWCATFWVKGMGETLAAEGLDVPALFRQAGLDHGALDDPDSRFPTDRVSLLWELAVAASGNPAVGLTGARRARPATFGIAAYTIMSAPNLLGALERTVRYVGIVSDAATVSLEKRAGRYRLALVLEPDRRPMPWQRLAFNLLTLLSYWRLVADRHVVPLGVELAGAAAPAVPVLRDVFGCAPTLGGDASAMTFSAEDAHRPLPTADRTLAPLHDRLAADRLAEIYESAITPRVRRAIAEALAAGAVSRAGVARSLALSERTLHRRLVESGASFQSLLSEVRRDRAAQLLAQRDLSIADIAYLLAFKDQTSFFKATQRWFGQTPSQYRAAAR